MTPRHTVDVPTGSASWNTIWEFALTYDAYSRHGGFEGAAHLGNSTAEQWRKDGTLPDSLWKSRAALFFEQRRYRHFGYGPEGDDADYIRALVDHVHRLSGGQALEADRFS